MIFKLFSIKDNITGNYSAPFLGVNDEDGKRAFAVMLQGNKFPNSDYELYSLGTFCCETGSILENKEFIVSGADYE